MRTTTLPSGVALPVLGQGTWRMGENARHRAQEIAALRSGIDLGMTLIDTAEMYADGGAEEIVAQAIAGHRHEVFIVSKVLPDNATRDGTIAACERSLRRLGTEHIDLYLLHWRGAIPLEETLEAFDRLMQSGKIHHWGVSNFDVSDMEELLGLTGGVAVATDQVLYNLSRRGIEHDLLPSCIRRDIPLMAYSPIEQGRLLSHPELYRVAAAHGVTTAQIALAWVLRQRCMIAIPKAATIDHVRQNRAALDIELTADELAALDRIFPPPTRAQPLEMI